MFLHVSAGHGCVFAMDDRTLIMTPLHDDMTFDTDWDNWIEVDHMSLLGEEQSIQNHVKWVESKLLSLQTRE